MNAVIADVGTAMASAWGGAAWAAARRPQRRYRASPVRVTCQSPHDQEISGSAEDRRTLRDREGFRPLGFGRASSRACRVTSPMTVGVRRSSTLLRLEWPRSACGFKGFAETAADARRCCCPTHPQPRNRSACLPTPRYNDATFGVCWSRQGDRGILI